MEDKTQDFYKNKKEKEVSYNSALIGLLIFVVFVGTIILLLS